MDLGERELQLHYRKRAETDKPARQYHAFNSAACMGTLVLKNPQSVMTQVAIGIVDSTIACYTSVVWSRNSPRMVKNLRWLVKLREKITTKVAQSPAASANEAPPASYGQDDDDVELLGWRTRLIERAGKGLQTARTIQSTGASSASPGEEPRFVPASNPLPPLQVPWDFHLPAMGAMDIDGESLVSRLLRTSIGSGETNFRPLKLNSFWDPTPSQDGPNWMTDVAVRKLCPNQLMGHFTELVLAEP